jgi:hypothetical protein
MTKPFDYLIVGAKNDCLVQILVLKLAANIDGALHFPQKVIKPLKVTGLNYVVLYLDFSTI